MTRRQWLAQMIGCAAVALAAGMGGAAPLARGAAGAVAQKAPECPANYEKNSPACKAAKAERRCPEQLGGKCQAGRK